MKKLLLSITCYFTFALTTNAQVLFGTTPSGGAAGLGTIGKFNASTNSLAVVASPPLFPSSLTKASNGKLYGMTAQGGSSGNGVIFSFDPSSNTFSKLKDFDGTNGGNPYGNLMQASDGKLYGMTTFGGSSGYGVIFSFDPSSSTYSKLKDFDGTNGAYPYGNLMQASDGKLYGMTVEGGIGTGVIFSFDPSSSTYSKLKNFDNTNGGYPYGSLMQASNGKLYGMTTQGGSSYPYGVIFSFDPSSSTYSKLKDLDYTNGGHPYGNLMQASDGKLYGMTVVGGSSNYGVIFSFDPSSSTYSKLKDFDFTNGAYPYGNLMQASDGKLYGMTYTGGSSSQGVIFSFDPVSATYTKLQDYNVINGARPYLGSAFVEVKNTTNITTSPLSITTYCQGSTLQVSYTAAGTYNAGNVFTAQLSDASGSFATPVNIGTLTSTANGTINATIPSNTPAGTNYRIRVVSGDPAISGSDNGTNITVNALPLASISAGGLTTFCPAGSVTLTSSTGDTYLWSTGATTSFITVNSSGSYSVKVTTNGCSATSAAIPVTVVDNLAPVPDVTILAAATGQCRVTVSTAPTATDNCKGSITGTTTDPLTYTVQGTYTITWTYNDGNGNTTTQTQKVIVKDVTNPTITAPAAVTVNNDAGKCSASGVSLGTPVTADNCGVATVSNNAPAVYPVGTTTVTWTVTDIAGNLTTATQTVTVTDNEKPTITAPTAVTVNNDAGKCSASGVSLGTPVTADNCGVATVSNNAPAVYPVGTTTVTWTVTDIHGNTNMATQTVTVTDNEKPTITAPAAVTVNNDAGKCSASGVILGTPVTADNCGVATVSNNAPAVYPVGTTTVTWTVTDIHGNTNMATQTVTVTDNEKPTITAPTAITVNNDAGKCSASGVILGTPVTTDNCGVATVSNNAPAVYPVGTTTVTWTVTDIHGNTNMATQTVTVTDNEKPTITAPTAVTVNNDAGKCSASGVSLGTPVTADNCGVATVSNNAPAVYPVGTTTVTWTITDIHGNTNMAAQTVTVTDNEKPTITAAANVSVNNDAGQCSATVTLAAPTTGDNCGVQSVSNDHPSTTYPVGTTTVTWTVTDIHGNTNMATQTVTVTDNEKPTFTRPADKTIYTTASCTYDAGTAATGDVTNEHDNCSVGLQATFTDVIVAGACEGSKIISRTWHLTDNNGNAAADQVQTITVSDNIPPTFTRPADKIIPFTTTSGYNASPTNTGEVTNVHDNCSTGLNATYTDAVSQCGNNIVINRTWRLADKCGNTATDQSQTITVTDNNTSYVVYAKSEAKFGKGNQINGSVGVTDVKGNAAFKKGSVLPSPYFVKAADIDVQSGASVPNRYEMPANDGPNPPFFSFSGTTTGLPDYTVSTSTAVPVSANFKNLTIKKNVTVTVTGTLYGKIVIGQGAKVTFNPPGGILNIESLQSGGDNERGTTQMLFGSSTSVRVKRKVNIGANSWVNIGGPKVIFYLGKDGKYEPGDDGEDESGNNGKEEVKFQVQGGSSTVNANVFIKNGSLMVEGDDEARNTMIGWFIAAKVTGKENVVWNPYRCSTPSIAKPMANSLVILKTIEPLPSKLEVRVMPNPTSYYFNLALKSASNENLKITVVDVTGRMIEQRTGVPANSALQLGNKYLPGIYIAEVMQGKDKVILRLIKGGN